MAEEKFNITAEFVPAPPFLPVMGSDYHENVNRIMGRVPVFTYHHDYNGVREDVALHNQHPNIRLVEADRWDAGDGTIVSFQDPVGLLDSFDDDFLKYYPGADEANFKDGNSYVKFIDGDHAARAEAWTAAQVTVQVATRFASYEKDRGYYQPLQFDEPCAPHLIAVQLTAGLGMEGREPETDRMGRKCWLVNFEVAGRRVPAYPDLMLFVYHDKSNAVVGAGLSLGDMCCYDEATGHRGSAKNFFGADAQEQALAWLRANTSLIATIGYEYR